MRPTPKAALLFAAGVPLALVAALVDANLWPVGLAYLGIALVALGIDGSRAMPPGDLRVAVTTPSVLHVGDQGDSLVLELEPAGGSAAVAVEYHLDAAPSLLAQRDGIVNLGVDQIGTITIDVQATRRGLARVDRIWLRWSGPLGLMRRELIWHIGVDIPVIANIRAVRSAALQLASLDTVLGQKTQSQRGEGSEFEALREYTPGLDSRAIDWKHSARHRALICKEFRAERNHQIVVAFDTGYLMREPLNQVAKVDHAINAGLLLAYAALRTGDRVGLFGFDEDVRLSTDFVAGTHRFGMLQAAAATLDYSADETNFTLGLSKLLGRLRRRSLIVLLTDFVDSTTAELMIDHLAHLVSRHLVLFVTFEDPELDRAISAPPSGIERVARSVIAEDTARERRVVMRQLSRLGVHCLEAPVEAIGPELINRYVAIKQQELI